MIGTPRVPAAINAVAICVDDGNASAVTPPVRSLNPSLRPALAPLFSLSNSMTPSAASAFASQKNFKFESPSRWRIALRSSASISVGSGISNCSIAAVAKRDWKVAMASIVAESDFRNASALSVRGPSAEIRSGCSLSKSERCRAAASNSAIGSTKAPSIQDSGTRTYCDWFCNAGSNARFAGGKSPA